MVRIIRTLPFAAIAVLLGLAVGSLLREAGSGMNAAISDGGGSMPAEPAANNNTLAELAVLEPRPLRSLDRPRPSILAASFPEEQPMIEPDWSSGPRLVDPIRPLNDSASTNENCSPFPQNAESPSSDTAWETPTLETAQTVEASAPASPWSAPDKSIETPGETISPLSDAASGGERSEQLELIARQVDNRTRHGLDLAGRGALFAARSEFLGALQLLAAGLDTEHGTDAHGRALAAALTAVKESDDFLPRGSRLESDMDIPSIVAGHATPVLKNRVEGVSPLAALKCYLTFAQEQFAKAAGGEVAGSMALHAMGKLHESLAQKKSLAVAAPESKAMLFFQAALLVDPNNHLAANDLGVLLARSGRFAEARTMLEHSLAIHRQSTGWHNLAVVYRQLGQVDRAARADRLAERQSRVESARRAAPAAPAAGAVQWVDPELFAANRSVEASAAAARWTPRPTLPADEARPTPTRALSAGPAVPAFRLGLKANAPSAGPATKRTFNGLPTY